MSHRIIDKQEKKALRKKNRFRNNLSNEENVLFAEEPTLHIIICNVGQATGVNREILLEAVTSELPQLKVTACVFVKGKCYCFISLASIEDACDLYSRYHGRLPLISGGPLLYMDFVTTGSTICYDRPPKGLKIYEDFLSDEEEAMLLKLFDWNDEHNSNELKNRRVKHYGYEFRYGTNDVDIESPLDNGIPKECEFLWLRLNKFGYTVSSVPDQLTVNKYEPGQGIPPHVDTHSPFGPVIMSLSLASPIVMDWRHRSGKIYPVHLKNKSMLIMENESRYDWLHGIAARTWDPNIEVSSDEKGSKVRIVSDVQSERKTRISLTFRWTNNGECKCSFPYLCDSQQKLTTESKIDLNQSDDNLSSKVEELYVHQIYDKIATHFSTTRHKAWPRVVEFVKNIPSGCILLDVGSGNGKNLSTRNDIAQIAIERSSGLLVECKENCKHVGGADCFRADMLNVPMVECCADVIICIAVIHHFSTEKRRIDSIKSIQRLLRPGGLALITVWARDQTKANYLKKNQNVNDYDKQAVTYAIAPGIELPVHQNRTQFEHSDLLVPWKLRNVEQKTNKIAEETENTYLRYYHVFEEEELRNLCSEANLRVVESFYEQGNWCVICEKRKDE